MNAALRPIVVLVEPQLGENVGAVARAMLNCGLDELRLVAPRDGWPNPKAYGMASGADEVLDHLEVFDDVATAIGDLQWIYATTARHRDMVKHEVTPAHAAVELRRRGALGERCGVVFGRERTGLYNEEVVLADAVLSIPLNPGFRSLNLAQAVLLVAWEWRRAADQTPPDVLVDAGRRPARRAEVVSFFDHLERALDAHGFFRVDEMRPATVRAIRNLFLRAELTEHDVRILHGIVAAFEGKKLPR